MRHKVTATKMLARNGWTAGHGIRLVLALTAAVAVAWPAWLEMARTAVQHEFARSSVLVLPVMFWLVWVRRARFRFVRPGNTGIGWVLLIAGAQLYFTNHAFFDLRSAGMFGAVLMAGGAVLAMTGRSVLIQFMPAWVIMPLLVPVPYTLADLIATPIQVFEAQAIAALYGLMGVSVEVFQKPGVSTVVVGGTTLPMDSVCKGLPTIMSLVLISYGFVFGSPMRSTVRAVLLMVAPFVALLCSALSLGGTLWLYDGRSALVTADLITALSGWATLLMAFLLIAGSLRLLAWASVPVHQYHLASTAS